MPKTLVGEQPFCAVFQKISGSEKVSKKSGRSINSFSPFFCLTVPKILLGEQPFCAVFQRNSGSEKVLKKRGRSIKSFSQMFLFLGAEQLVRGTTLLCCVSENFRWRKSFEKEGEEY